ncbi:MAG: hypothetical protein AB7P04_00745 [Bacteriovoracia bacterium]
MSARKLIAFLVPVITAAVIWKLLTPEPSTPDPAESQPSEESLAQSDTGSKEAPLPLASPAYPNPGASLGMPTSSPTSPAPVVTLQLPKPEKVAAEQRADAHATPPSLHEFAEQMAEHMEKAKASPEYAQALFPKLRECALDEDSPLRSVQSTCTVNAARLARQYPDKFDDEFQEMAKKLNIKIKSLVRASGFAPKDGKQPPNSPPEK